MTQFVPGQRWISDTEPELGLGTILSVEARSISVLFTESDEHRQYSSANPPLSRAVFRVGDHITSHDGSSLTIDAIEEEDGLLTYCGGEQKILESELSDRPPQRRPQDRILQGDVDEPGLFDLRLECHRQRARLAASPVRGLLGARIELLPHQQYIAHEVTRRATPRVLLSDEVGLGKTIEACLVMHRLLVTGRIQRVLILVPEPLIHQWFVELLRRFNMTVSIYDEERCAAAEESSPQGNPFLDEAIVLCPISLFNQPGPRREQAAHADWDLLIVDEAHHLEWNPDDPDTDYYFVERLAYQIPAVMLLTATPEELGPESHFARLRLLDPDRYTSLQVFQTESTQYSEMAHEVDKLLEKGQDISELLDRYGPGRVMFRNSRRLMTGFPERRLALAPLKDESERVTWLAELLRRLDHEKVLLICTSRQQVLELAEALPRHIQLPTALFHEDMALIQRDRAAAWFAEPDGARLLLSSEIGGEGRNFQFAHHLVLYDIPEHPEVVEQRIGRLDRIGQGSHITIHVPFVEDSLEAWRVRWLNEGLQVFNRCLQGGDELYRRYKHHLASPDESLISETRKYADALQKRLAEGCHRLLELNSFNEDIAQNIISQIKALDKDPLFEPLMLRLFDHFGIDADELSEGCWHLSPGHTFRDGLPGFPREGMTVTFDRQRALEREDWVFMTWDHPLPNAMFDDLLGGQDGNAALGCSDYSELKGIGVEAVFVLETSGPAHLHSDRFLPVTALRIGLNIDGSPLPPVTGRIVDGRHTGILNHAEKLRVRLDEMLETCTDQGKAEASAVENTALKTMHTVMDVEYRRLEYLAELNTHVGPKELHAIKQIIRQLTICIKEARLRLDAVRLMVSPPDR
jgi:ATP-dependent helicase HepA